MIERNRKSLIRNLSILCSSIFVILTIFTSLGAAAERQTTILLDGYPLAFPVEPQIMQGTTMVPFRAIAEALRITVQWEPKTKTITAVKTTDQGKKTVVLQMGNPVAKVNGEALQLPMKPMERSGSTLIPLSFFSRQFGAQVAWDGPTSTVTIKSPAERMYSMAFYAISSYDEKPLIDRFDTVSFGWAKIGDDSKLTTGEKVFGWPKPAGEVTPESIIAETEDGGTAPYLMVFAGDGKGELTKMLEDTALRDQALRDIMRLATDKQFSGITLDFEGLGLTGDAQKARQSYTDFVRLLAKSAHESGLKLALVLHPLNSSFQGYDYKTLGTIADELIIMAYAYEDEKQPEPLNRVDQAIKLALAQTAKSKLLLGISMGSENAQSVAGKIGLAKRYDLKGIAVWRLGLIGQPAVEQIQRSVLPLRA